MINIKDLERAWYGSDELDEVRPLLNTGMGLVDACLLYDRCRRNIDYAQAVYWIAKSVGQTTDVVLGSRHSMGDRLKWLIGGGS